MFSKLNNLNAIERIYLFFNLEERICVQNVINKQTE